MALAQATFERTTFQTSRLLEFFSESELQMQIGFSQSGWAIALIKELIDNALDACESADVSPEIEVRVEPNAVSVRDNGPGLPTNVLEKSLDYSIRVSDKSHYVSPTRGQLGNALKCVWAAPFVADGEQGSIEVSTGGNTHLIDVALDRIGQVPKISHHVKSDAFVKNGTFVKMHWSGIASLLSNEIRPDFYNASTLPDVRELVLRYAAFNPHGGFSVTLADDDGNEQKSKFQPTIGDWKKWLPNQPTSPHWYTTERLQGLNPQLRILGQIPI